MKLIAGECDSLGMVTGTCAHDSILQHPRSYRADLVVCTTDLIRADHLKIFSLEEAIEFIQDDELIEVTPKSIRLRKVVLDTPSRKRIQAAKRAALKEQQK